MLRRFWHAELERAFEARSIVWLAGVRRVGKTTLARSLPNARYFDCELARVRRSLEEPELFFSREGDAEGVIVLDEIHRLSNPSEVLKIASDHFPETRVLGTGSSTLAARSKFRDTLTGRKRDVYLVPMLLTDLSDFGSDDIERRLLHGGLPPFFLRERLDDKDFEEWVQSYWAKDLSELFVIDKRTSFMRFVELVFAQSGRLFEAKALAGPCEVSRQTIVNWLSVLETTLLVTVLRPYHATLAGEIKSQPKVYAFDSGFVAYFKGWDSLRDDDRGHLLEHLVLGELLARFGAGRIHFWRDKRQHEVDFVLEVGRRRSIVAIECKASASRFDPAGLRAFRAKHPGGTNVLVALYATARERRMFGELEVDILPLREFGKWLEEQRQGRSA
jgi:predicted AAA+ superfamily ATPase